MISTGEGIKFTSIDVISSECVNYDFSRYLEMMKFWLRWPLKLKITSSDHFLGKELHNLTLVTKCYWFFQNIFFFSKWEFLCFTKWYFFYKMCFLYFTKWSFVTTWAFCVLQNGPFFTKWAFCVLQNGLFYKMGHNRCV